MQDLGAAGAALLEELVHVIEFGKLSEVRLGIREALVGVNLVEVTDRGMSHQRRGDEPR